jgi:hypothetical protein
MFAQILMIILPFQNVLFWGFIEERIIADEIFGSDSDSDSSDFFGAF